MMIKKTSIAPTMPDSQRGQCTKQFCSPMITNELRPPPGFRSRLPLLSSLSSDAARAADPVSVTDPDTKVVSGWDAELALEDWVAIGVS